MSREALTTLIETECPELVKTTEASEEVGQVGASTKVGDVAGLEFLGANANAGVAKASASSKVSPAGASAQARAAGPEAGANAILIEGIVEANSKAVTAEAGASAGFTLENLGVKAEAGATLGKAAIGIKHTPLKAHIQGPSASGETGISWDYTGGNVGASLGNYTRFVVVVVLFYFFIFIFYIPIYNIGEARAGPFAARAGVKFGAGIRNGIPEVDAGPVTVPCVVM